MSLWIMWRTTSDRVVVTASGRGRPFFLRRLPDAREGSRVTSSNRGRERPGQAGTSGID